MHSEENQHPESEFAPQEAASPAPLNGAAGFDEAAEASGIIPDTTDSEIGSEAVAEVTQSLPELLRQEQALRQEVARLQGERSRLMAEQQATRQKLSELVEDSLRDAQKRKQVLEMEIERLERRRDRIQKEMRTTFAGVSQDLAIRVQGFKEYLVGSLQDLVAAADQLELPSDRTPELKEAPAPTEAPEMTTSTGDRGAVPEFTKSRFRDQMRQIRRLLDEYRTAPDYYGPPWQLRRTFEPIHAERVSQWFFSQGGRGALRTMGTRLQNILIASAAISVLHNGNGDRLRALVLANSPERLGEWRRGLQDCLGIARGDFGPDRGVGLFESPEALSQKADRLLKEGRIPLIIIDDTEERINLSILQFPLWLAFAPDPATPSPSPSSGKMDY